ncbi:MAG: transposase, partial [Bacteroidota bacterium]
VLTKENRFQNIGKNSVSSIIGSYKSAVSKHAHRLGYEFQWQRRFHGHIIRDDRAFRNISLYIKRNPEKFKQSIQVQP